MDPIPPVTSNTVPTGEPAPTGGQELCPGYNDVCIFDDAGQTRTVFQCDGTARIRLNADPFGTEYDDMYPRDYTFPFAVKSYEQAQVIACCSDQYVDGCADLGLRPPHERYCLLDCAQQSCFRMVYELRATIKKLEDDGKTPAFALNKFVAVHDYMVANIKDCYNALYDRLECDAIAEEKGVASAGYCDVPNILRGRYRIPNSEKWDLIKDLRGDLECEVTDYTHPDKGAITCQGIQGNDDAPFGAAIVQPLQSMDEVKHAGP